MPTTNNDVNLVQYICCVGVFMLVVVGLIWLLCFTNGLKGGSLILT